MPVAQKVAKKKSSSKNERNGSVKRSAKKPVAKTQPTKKKPVTTIAKKSVSKKTTPRTVAKKPLAKTSAKKVIAKKPVSKKPVTKNTAKKPLTKISAKKVAKRPLAKKPAKKVVAKKPLPKKPAIKAPARTVVSKKPIPKATNSKTITAKVTISKTTTPKVMSSTNTWRLPRTAIPEHYQISLQPQLESQTFSGSVEITVAVNEATNKIVLNAKEIEITQAFLVGSDNKEITAKVSYDKEKEFAFLTLPQSLKPGSYKIICQFTGILNDKLKGFYHSTWVDEKGGKHPMAVTQFESTDARRAFPCFDEPDMKATYDVTLRVPKDLTALSNGRVISETVDGTSGLKTVRFRKTMKMSTYLLAFLVGEFVSSKVVMANGIELRAWTVPGKERLTSFALDAAAFTIVYFEKYFGVPYPDPDKCDFIAIPDFAAGAMENKDCITFRETALLLDEKTATQGELERVAEVVMHELAHMWFGDLVTMRWWNGLWLNEAFATFMEMKCLDNYRPEWKVWDKFGMSRAAALRVDSLKSTHPIECPVNKPEEAQELFDVISYQKGCSVLYQIEQFIGEDIFQKGINHYLNTHSYQNTETHDLWESLEIACKQAGVGIPVRKIMDNWVFTPGHPILTIKEGKTIDTVDVDQKPFMFLPDKANTKIYQVPVTMRSVSGNRTAVERFLLGEKKKTVTLAKGVQSIVANAGGSGFYRVNYSPLLASNLLSNAQENLSVIERFNLVNDSWAAVRGGFLSATDYLDMIRKFEDESDVSVWTIIVSSLGTIRTLTRGPAREDFQHFVRSLCQQKATELGWQPKANEASQTKQLRGLLIDAMGTLGEDSATYEQAQKAFQSWRKDKNSIDSNILPAIVSVLAYHGDSSRYDEYKELSKQAKTPQETLRFLYALAQFRDPQLLAQTMASCLSDEVRTQDAPFLFAMVSNNEIATVPAWKFMQKNWQQMIKAYPETGAVRMCSSLIPALDSPELEKEAEVFFASHKIKAGDMAISQALELLRVNVLLRQRESQKLATYFEKMAH